MTVYRFYTLAKGRIENPPDIVECVDDQAAIEEARARADGHAIEIWDNARLVISLGPGDPGTSPGFPPADDGAVEPTARFRRNRARTDGLTGTSLVRVRFMPPRPFWKGYLKLSLVTCPVAMTPATSENEKVRFHTLNRHTGNRVLSRYVDAESGKPIDDDGLAKGYARGESDYVLFEDDELEAVGLESTRTIDIDMFAPADSIDWIWCDKPHYMTPDDAVGEEAFCVIRDAMEATRTVGISRLVLYGRERAVMLKPRDKGIVLWTLRYGDEVREGADYLGTRARDPVDRKALGEFSKLIDKRLARWSPDMMRDPVQSRLLEIIASKKRTQKKPARQAPRATTGKPANVVDITDALRKSLASEKASRRP